MQRNKRTHSNQLNIFAIQHVWKKLVDGNCGNSSEDELWDTAVGHGDGIDGSFVLRRLFLNGSQGRGALHDFPAATDDPIEQTKQR